MKNLTKICPPPQKITVKEEKVKIGSLGEANFRIIAEGIDGELAQNALSELYLGIDKLMYVSSRDADGAVEISLSISNDIPKEVKANPEQAYQLLASGNKISLIGYGELGFFYAVNTFLKSIEVENNVVFINEMSIIDYPDLKTRGHFMESRFGSNLMTLEDWKSVIDDMVSKKMNQLVVALYGCWNIQYDGIVSNYVYISVPKYPLIKSDVIKKYYSPKNNAWINEVQEVPMVKEDFFGELIKYGKSRGVEVLPLWNSYGHNVLIPTVYPEVAPKHADGPSKAAFCISSPKTKQLLFDIYDHIIDKYLKPNGITSFHIGLDEVRPEHAIDVNDPKRRYSPWCECEECAKLPTNEDKLFTHAITLIKYLKSRGMKTVYMYTDVIEKMNADRFKDMLEKEDLLDVIVLDWWQYRNFKNNLRFTNLRPDLGIRATVKPMNSYTHWTGCRDYVGNCYWLCEMAKRDGAEGLQSYAAWDKTCDINHSAMSDMSWNFDATGSIEEFRKTYARREFNSSYDKAIEALGLFSKFSDTASTSGDPNVSVTIGGLVKEICSYYAYSYVIPTLDYPRNFPGEPLTKMIKDRKPYERVLKQAYRIANKGYKLFTEVEKDVECNTALAHRYAVEMRNYRDLAKDYLAFLEIHDILATNERSAEVSRKISEIARERKNAKISLMLEMENFKEHYLIPSHLRNLSIIMQVFADIEAYVNVTEPEKLELDMRDLRPIGSKLFFGIR